MAILDILAIAAGVATCAVATTFLAPRKIHIERSEVIDATPSEVIALAASNSGYQRFNPYCNSDPDLKIELYGPDQGVGSAFRFNGKDGKGTQTVEKVTDNQVIYAIDLGPMGKPTQSITVAPVENGTQVTWSMDADMGVNPIFRVFGLFMDRMMGKTFITGLNNLKLATA